MISDKRYKILIGRMKECQNVTKPNSPKLKENSTIGKLEIWDSKEKNKVLFSCYTLENGGPSTDESGRDKRIVSRDYNLEWTESARNGNLSKQYPKFKRGERNLAVWLICDEILPKFRNRRILIHIGNYPQDTEGCILLGYGKNENAGYINDSVRCVKDFYEMLEKLGIENCFLRVLEI